MRLKNKRIFVSGGAGVIGSALTLLLLEEGAKVFVGDLKPKPLHWPDEILYRQGDLNYIGREELLDFNPEIFFHLAATFERSTETFEFWEENYQHNLRLSNYLMSILKTGDALERVIFASSYLIYNPEQYYFSTPAKEAFRLKETDPIKPRNLCGTAKLMHEMELNFFAHFNQVKFTTVSARIFRVYGKNSRDIISRWVRSLLKGETLTVYKQEGLFDYIYAGEVAEGLLRLSQSKVEGIVNLGNDRARRVSEVLEVLKKYFPGLKTVHENIDIPYEGSQANMDYFKKVTNWAPSRQIEDVIPEIIRFEKEIGFHDHADSANLNVLVTSISAKVPLINSLKKANLKLGNKGKITGGDVNPDCIGRYFTDEFWNMPKLSELSIERLIAYCSEKRITAIIPSRDGELEFFANAKSALKEKGIHVMISDPSAVENCIDKLKFYQVLNKLGLPAIKTMENIDQLEGDQFVVKERYGAGSRNIGINLSRQEAVRHAGLLHAPVFQPYIKGREVSIDLYLDSRNKAKGAIVRSRDLVVDGESQITTTMRNPELEKLGSETGEKLGLYGHVVLQVMIGERGDFHIIECNSRFGGASSLSVEAGLDSFYWFLLEVQNIDISRYAFHRSIGEKKQVRYKSDFIL